MNKNLKRALNTTAAVSMSLAMVLGAVAPNTATSVAAESSCKVVNEDLDIILNAIGDIDTAKLTDTIATSSDVEVAGNLENFLMNGKIKGYRGLVIDVVDVLKDAKVCALEADDEEAENLADKLLGMVDGVGKAEQAIFDLEQVMKKEGNNTLTGTITPEYSSLVGNLDVDADINVGNLKLATKLYNTLSKEGGSVQTYLNNLEDKYIDVYDSYFAELEEIVEYGKDDNYDEVVEEYVAALKAVTYDGNKVEDLVKGDQHVALNSSRSVKNFVEFVEDIQNDKISTLKEIASYEDVADEEDVAEIMDVLITAAENAEEAYDLLSSKNKFKKAYTSALKAKVKVDNTDVTLRQFVSNSDGSNKIFTNEDEFLAVLGLFEVEDLEAVADYYNEVVARFYDLEVKERANGNYTVSLEAGELAIFDDSLAVKNELNALVSTINKKEELTYLEEVVARPADVEAALEAITTGLKGITVNNLNASNVDKVIAAEDAYEMLTTNAEDGGYAQNLTKSQTRTVKDAKRNVETLVTKMYNDGIVAGTTGWVQNSDGSWSFFEEDGTVRQYGWVAGNGVWSFVKNGKAAYNDWCAAKEGWYYMGADGYMVYNTTLTIDGVSYTFDANGLLVD